MGVCSSGEEGKTVALSLRPYHRIESIDWDGDEYYGFPTSICISTALRNSPMNGLAYAKERAEWAGVLYRSC